MSHGVLILRHQHLVSEAALMIRCTCHQVPKNQLQNKLSQVHTKLFTDTVMSFHTVVKQAQQKCAPKHALIQV